MGAKDEVKRRKMSSPRCRALDGPETSIVHFNALFCVYMMNDDRHSNDDDD